MIGPDSNTPAHLGRPAETILPVEVSYDLGSLPTDIEMHQALVTVVQLVVQLNDQLFKFCSPCDIHNLRSTTKGFVSSEVFFKKYLNWSCRSGLEQKSSVRASE